MKTGSNSVTDQVAPQQATGNGPPGGPPGHAVVTIMINGNPVRLERGTYTVAQLKDKGGIPACDELNEVRGGRAHPIPNPDRVHIEGGEIFESSPGSCTSS